MQNANIKTIDDMIEKLKQIELSLSKFYGMCSESFSIDKVFWHRLSEEEKSHANLLNKLHEEIKKNESEFAMGRFHYEALMTFIQGIEDVTKRLKHGEIVRKKAFTIAMDFEKSLVERHFFDVVKSENARFLSVKKSLVEASKAHYQRLRDYVSLPGRTGD
jgi:hypothetical protein